MTVSPYTAVRVRREQRHAKLNALGFPSYGAYMNSSHWRATKARYRASDQPQDCMCGVEDVQLHHLTYERIGAEELADLTPLCRRCHTMIHALEMRGDLGLDFSGFVSEKRAQRHAVDQDRFYARQERWEDVRAPEEQKRRCRWIRRKLAGAVIAADRARVDITPELNVIAELIADIDHKRLEASRYRQRRKQEKAA